MCMLLLMHKHTAIVPDNDNYCLHVVTFLMTDHHIFLSAFSLHYLPESRCRLSPKLSWELNQSIAGMEYSGKKYLE